MEKPAIEGGKKIRESYLPYGLHWIDDDDVRAVSKVLQGDWITQGPEISKFEKNFCDKVGCDNAIAVNSGTSALTVSLAAAGISAGDEVITSPITFVASPNSILHLNAKPVFVDIESETGNMDVEKLKSAITKKTKAIMPVHYAGQPCDMDEIMDIAEKNGLLVIEDAAHALGASFGGKNIGTIGDVSNFSFHPVKHITSGEGGMITTNNDTIAEKARMLRAHGIKKPIKGKPAWYYEMRMLGWNYRMTSFQAALASSQLKKLDRFLAKRREYAKRYTKALEGLPGVITPPTKPSREHAWHIYVIRIDPNAISVNRNRIFDALRSENIGVQVHYYPVHLQPYYIDRYGYKPGTFPIAEQFAKTCISIPLFPKMDEKDFTDVVDAMEKIMRYYAK